MIVKDNYYLFFYVFIVCSAVLLIFLLFKLHKVSEEEKKEYLNSYVEISNREIQDRLVENRKKAAEQMAGDLVRQKYKYDPSAMYKQNGEYRSSVLKLFYDTENKINSSLCLSEDETYLFISSLQQNGLITEDGKVKRKDIDGLLKEYGSFLYSLDSIRDKKQKEKITESGVTPEEFLKYKMNSNGDIVGVYIIYNQSKDMYYVGQAKRLFFRVNQHFTGHGNGDVYADYKYGDRFIIKLIPLNESGYDDIDKLEKDKIEEYKAKEAGYNKTTGNGS